MARAHVGHRTDRFFDTVFVYAGVLFVAMLFAAAAAAGSLPAAIEYQSGRVPSSSAVELDRALAYSLLFTFGIKAAGVFMMVTSTIAYRTGGLARWFVYASWALAGILLFSVSFFQLVVLVFPIWVAAVSLVILFRGGIRDEPGGA